MRTATREKILAEVNRRVEEKIKEAYAHLGFRAAGASWFSFWFWDRPTGVAGTYPPRFSVSDRVDAIAAHLGLVFDKTEAEPAKVILRNPDKKKDGQEVIYHKKSLRVGGGK